MFTYLKRRFSSGDLQGELEDQRQQEGLPGFLNFNSNQPQTSGQPPKPPNSTGGMPGQMPPQSNAQPGPGMPPGQQQPARKGPFPSAPTSPSKSSSFNPMGSITGQISSTITRGIFSSNKPSYNKERCKVLLIIDEPHTDW